MNIYEKLLNIQTELKAPKGQTNKFGGYKYRSCEDILEAVKPLCKKNKATLILSDSLENYGDRYYIKATATLLSTEFDKEGRLESIGNSAFARESETKKGMDESQITGTASSYARKYALNGLFNIDDTKDADTNEFKKQQENGKNKTITKVQENALRQIIKDTHTDNQTVLDILDDYGYERLSEIEMSDYKKIVNEFTLVEQK